MKKIKVAKVYFEVPTMSYYFKTDIRGLQEKDIVVVDTKYGVKVATFLKYIKPTEKILSKATMWLIQKVDLLDFERRKSLYEANESDIEGE